MQLDKIKRNRSAFFGSIGASIIFAILIFFLYFVFGIGKYNDKHVLIVLIICAGFLFLLGFIGVLVSYIKYPSKYCVIRVDAFRQKYNVANNATWFFNNLSSSQLLVIKKKIDELEKYKFSKLNNIKSQTKKEKFLKNNKILKYSFFCCIYRTGTRYTQTNYVKSPYKAETDYWGKFFSLDEMKQYIS